jgi:uncharacterized protein YjbJ (UPF0337 family)
VAQESTEVRGDRQREQSPEEIRRDIERTRAGLGETLEDIEDRVSPTRIRQRQTARLRGRWTQVRESVMGPDDESSGVRQVGDRTGEAADRMRHAPDEAVARTRGNPLAAGLIAFGGGLLAASLIPASRQEQQAAQQLRDRFEEPVREELRHAGQETRDRLEGSAQQAAEQVKATAQEGVQHTREDARQATERTRQEAEGAAQRTRSDAEQTAGRVRDETQRAGQETRDHLH